MAGRGKRAAASEPTEPTKPMLADALLAAIAAGDKALVPFEGREVLSCAIEIPNAAGGFRESIAFDPVEIHHGQEGYLIAHWRARKVRFDEVKDTDGLRRVAVIDIDNAGFATDEWADHAAEFLDGQRERIRLLKEKAQGSRRLDDPEHGLAVVADPEGFEDPGEGGYPDPDAEG